jgi:hypothetical protein
MADQRHALVQVAADCGPSIERWENEGGALLDDRRVGGGGGWLREPAGSTGTRSRPATSQVGAATTSRRSRFTRRTDLSPSRAFRSRSHDRNGRSPCPDRRETALGTVARFSPQPASLEVPGWIAFSLLSLGACVLVARHLSAASWPWTARTSSWSSSPDARTSPASASADSERRLFPRTERPDAARCLAACGAAAASGAILPFRLDYVVKISHRARARRGEAWAGDDCLWGAQIQFRHAVQDWVKSVNFARSLRGCVRLTSTPQI